MQLPCGLRSEVLLELFHRAVSATLVTVARRFVDKLFAYQRHQRTAIVILEGQLY